jgi:hypothetical protein
MYQTNPPLSPQETLPTMYDLPSEDPEESGVPSAEGVSLEVSSSACPARDEFHNFQPELLRLTFQPSTHNPDQIFTGSDKIQSL